MKINDSISPAVINAAVGMLAQFVPDLTPTAFIAALKEYSTENKAASRSSRPEKPYTVAEAAKLLGISKPTVYRMFDDGTLTRLKVRHSTRIPAEEIHRLISN